MEARRGEYVAHDLEQLGDGVKKARKSLGMSQEDLAGEIGVNRATVSSLENGVNTSTKTMMEAARSMGMAIIIAPSRPSGKGRKREQGKGRA